MKNLKQLLGLCEHQWKIRDEAERVGTESGRTKGILYTLQCQKCGDIKHSEMNIL